MPLSAPPTFKAIPDITDSELIRAAARADAYYDTSVNIPSRYLWINAIDAESLRGPKYTYNEDTGEFVEETFYFLPELRICGTKTSLVDFTRNPNILENYVHTANPPVEQVPHFTKIELEDVLTNEDLLYGGDDEEFEGVHVEVFHEPGSYLINIEDDYIRWYDDEPFVMSVEYHDYEHFSRIEEVIGISLDKLLNLNNFQIYDRTQIKSEGNLYESGPLEVISEMDEDDNLIVKVEDLVKFTYNLEDEFKIENFKVIEGDIRLVASNILY